MGFGITSIEHALATAFRDIVVGEKAVAKVMTKVVNEQAQIEAITAIIPGYGSAGVAIERISFALLGSVVAALDAAGNAASAEGMNVSFDKEVIAAIKAIIAAYPAEIAAAKAAVGTTPAVSK